MTDREAFLTRWSRRKREAAATRAEPLPEEPAVPAEAENEKTEPPNVPPVSAPQPASDVELPPIDSIDAGTDVRAFLEDGVPQDLARAALRRAWSSDPAIRDFIGLSENAWDFNAPEGVPGFGPFAPDAARQLVAQVFGKTSPASGAEASVPAVAERDRSLASDRDVGQEAVKAEERGGTEAQPAGGVPAPAEPDRDPENTAMQQQAAGAEPPRASD
jgi:hypothetical protein